MMQDPKERLMTSVSTAELERRWAAVREMMRAEKIDFLIMRNEEGMLGGYVRWITDLPARNNYHVTAIFPEDDEMTLISHGPAAPGEPMPPAWAARGVKKRLSAPYFASARSTHTWDGEMAVDVLKEKKGATIGLVGPAFIPISFFESSHPQGGKGSGYTVAPSHFQLDNDFVKTNTNNATSLTNGQLAKPEQPKINSLSQQQVARINAHLNQAFGQYFNYPRLAQRNGWQGIVKLGLRVESNGQLSHIRLLSTSGFPVLDQAALETLNRISTLQDVDIWLKGLHFDTVLPIQFKLVDS